MGAQFVLDKAKKNSRRLFVIVKCAKAVCVCVCVCVYNHQPVPALFTQTSEFQASLSLHTEHLFSLQ